MTLNWRSRQVDVNRGITTEARLSPFTAGLEWAKEKWSDSAAVVERTEQCHGSHRDGKGKGSVCAALGTCSIQAQTKIIILTDWQRIILKSKWK